MTVSGKGSIEQMDKGQRSRCRRWRLWSRCDGRNRSRVFHGTYREALRALESFRAELSEEIPVSETFGAYAASWALSRANSGAYDPNTLAKDARNVRALSAVLGDRALSSITADDCRDALARIRGGENASGRELRATTMQTMHVYLSMILSEACEDGLMAANPMRRVKAPRSDTAERRALSAGELSALLDATEMLPLDGRVVAVWLMACLGLRRGEACALMDSDVEGGVAHVRHAVKEADGSVGRPKSASGVRTLPMPPRLAEKVEEWRSVREERGYGDAPTLACNTDGGVLLPQNLYKWWRKVSPTLGTDVTMHELRHSNLTLVARHMSPFDLQRYAGWSSLEPARVYIHEDIDAMTRGVSEAWEGF